MRNHNCDNCNLVARHTCFLSRVAEQSMVTIKQSKTLHSLSFIDITCFFFRNLFLFLIRILVPVFFSSKYTFCGVSVSIADLYLLLSACCGFRGGDLIDVLKLAVILSEKSLKHLDQDYWSA